MSEQPNGTAQIKALVENYHSDKTTLTAAETLLAIGELLGIVHRGLHGTFTDADLKAAGVEPLKAVCDRNWSCEHYETVQASTDWADVAELRDWYLRDVKALTESIQQLRSYVQQLPRFECSDVWGMEPTPGGEWLRLDDVLALLNSQQEKS